MRYSGLRFASILLRIFGWFLLAASIIGFLGFLIELINQHFQPVYLPGLDMVTISIISSMLAFGFLSGLWFLAFGEVMKVFVDIARNTEHLSYIAQDTNYFYDRFKVLPTRADDRRA